MRKKLGDFLVNKGWVSKESIQSSLDKQRATRDKLGSILVNEGHLSKTQLIEALAEYLEIPLVDPNEIQLSERVLSMIPKAVALKHGVVPVMLRNETDLMVACTGTIPPATVENLRRITGKRIMPVLMGWDEFSALLERAYRESTGGRDPQRVNVGPTVDADSPDYAVSMLDGIITRAISMKASDIHLEPELEGLRVRFRIDGVLRSVDELPSSASATIISRVKVLANMNIAERRSPQDGGFAFNNMNLNAAPINIRVSSLPRPRGEKAVLRLLPSQDQVMSLEDLGMESSALVHFNEAVHVPHGILFVTGPTGSGKSTTLYSVIKILRSDEVNITTVEDPIELQMARVNQTQVDTANKLTFARALRSILRQDPDIIMVGEVRDKETAELALQAALTGHLVLSTLHTNDARSAFIRLLDMDCEPYLVSSAVRCVVAQRLIRTNCPNCLEVLHPDEGILASLGIQEDKSIIYKGGTGCVYCHDTGFKGRTGIFELIVTDHELRKIIVNKADPDALESWQVKAGFRSLRADGIDKIRRGVTTPEEVLRVTLDW